MEPNQTSLRDQILAAAARLFVQRGYDGVAMREIAEACAISKAGVYYHFKDKQDLFLALLNANLDHLEDLWARAVVDGSTCRARITRFSRALFEHLSSDERALIRLANQEMSKLSPDRRENFGLRYHNAFLLPLTAEFQAGIAAGEFKTHDPHLLVWILLGMLYPFLSPSSDTRPDNHLRAVETALSIFFEGAAA